MVWKDMWKGYILPNGTTTCDICEDHQGNPYIVSCNVSPYGKYYDLYKYPESYEPVEPVKEIKKPKNKKPIITLTGEHHRRINL